MMKNCTHRVTNRPLDSHDCEKNVTQCKAAFSVERSNATKPNELIFIQYSLSICFVCSFILWSVA